MKQIKLYLLTGAILVMTGYTAFAACDGSCAASGGKCENPGAGCGDGCTCREAVSYSGCKCDTAA